MILDRHHPLIRKLVKRGFKVSAHAYLLGDRVALSYVATDRESEFTLCGRSPTGDAKEALRALAKRADFLAGQARSTAGSARRARTLKRRS